MEGMKRFFFGNVPPKGTIPLNSSPKKKNDNTTQKKSYKIDIKKMKDELQELREMLQSKGIEEKREALRKIVLATAEGKDCSFMFMDVLKIIQTNDVSLKQLIYLYISAYASTDDQQAILGVNSLIIDSKHHDAHVRGLALRTMGNIRLQMTAEYFVQPLLNGLDDNDPYVRRNAVLGLLKLLHIPNTSIDREAIEKKFVLLLNDTDSCVVANVINAINELPEMLHLLKSPETVSKMIELIDGASDFTQAVFIKCFTNYIPSSSQEAERITQKVFDKGSVTNEGVVIDTLKLVLRYQPFLNTSKVEEYFSILANIIMKMNASLTSSKQYDVLYIFYRNIKHFLFIQRKLFVSQLFCFYISYEDPINLRIEKLEILLSLAEETNVKDLLDELTEDSLASLDFAPKTLKAIATLVTKFPSLASQCVSSILRISNEVPQLSESCLVALSEILIHTDGMYLKALPLLLNNIENLENLEAKCALIYLCGEFVTKITNAKEFIARCIEKYTDECLEVRLALLTACGKIYCEVPFTETTQKVLEIAIKSIECDERERAVYIWRVLSGGEKLIKGKTVGMEKVIERREMLMNIGSISTVLEIPKKDIKSYSEPKKTIKNIIGDKEKQQELDEKNKTIYAQLKQKRNQGNQKILSVENERINSLINVSNNIHQFDVDGMIIKKEGKLFMKMRIKNISGVIINGLFMQINNNSFGLSCGTFDKTTLQVDEIYSTDLPLYFNGSSLEGQMNNVMQLGISHSTKQLIVDLK
ncbi:AP-2 complex subunit beta, putative [Entamoeba dispar SAW760]|uniref:AP complex subunit beta n=1 Tax=Entamoeba dispar (strain ATCC PRA-260 / SAW760) TaxID=370354 RepID=B0EHQ0_ENTDS|nr:AP-2 complex subunit beta, putative [Entamoeba dispar SAW760]EDR25946.1 AP-2 complex subunit beta, putative [Entamoeba dispar SAW760]|eukprot:EDR25946.1 AP-2 complex subunit beta, putative [Entamoeba dispar SAW760]